MPLLANPQIHAKIDTKNNTNLNAAGHEHHGAQDLQKRDSRLCIVIWLVQRMPDLRGLRKNRKSRRQQTDYRERQQNQLKREAPASGTRAQTYQARTDGESTGNDNQPCCPARLMLDDEHKHDCGDSSSQYEKVQDQEQRRRAHGNVPFEASSCHCCGPSTQLPASTNAKPVTNRTSSHANHLKA